MLKVAEIFQDNMVLQQGKDLFIWGTAQKGSRVVIEIQDKHVEAAVDGEGNWMAQLPPLMVSVQDKMRISGSNDETIELGNIAVGEVWIAGGQSNMEFPLKFEKHYQEEKKNTANGRIRFYDVPKISFEGQRQAFDYKKTGIWRVAAPEEIGYFSAVGYYFAKELEKSRKVPVGIVGCNWGGTSISAWIPEETMKNLNNYWYQKYLEDTQIDMDQYWEQELHNPQNDTGNLVDNPMNEYIMSNTVTMEQMGQYLHEKMGISFEQMAEGLQRPQPQSFPGCLFRHMVKTIAPYGARGVLWYQGESDDVEGQQYLYETMLGVCIRDWRKIWKEDLPFLIVQLPGFGEWMSGQSLDYPKIRACQEKITDEMEHSYLCSIADAGEEKDIHPKDKQVVGSRLALLARGHIYGENLLCDPPRCVSGERDGNRIALSFVNVDTGLVVKGEKINALSIRSETGEIHYTFRIDQNRIILETEDLGAGEVSIAFAKTNWYCVNLYNQAGIPAVPFQISL